MSNSTVFNKEFEKAYLSYIQSFYNYNEDEGNIFNTSKEQIKKEALAYIELKYIKLQDELTKSYLTYIQNIQNT